MSTRGSRWACMVLVVGAFAGCFGRGTEKTKDHLRAQANELQREVDQLRRDVDGVRGASDVQVRAAAEGNGTAMLLPGGNAGDVGVSWESTHAGQRFRGEAHPQGGGERVPATVSVRRGGS